MKEIALEKPDKHKTLKQWLLDMFAGSRMRFELLKYNLGPLLVVEVVYTLITGAIIVPLFSKASQVIVDISGLGSLTADNVTAFLTNPLTLLCMLVLVVCIALYSMLDIGAAIYTFDCSRQQKKVSVVQIIVFSLKNAIRMFRPRNLPIIIVCLVLVPFMGLAMSSSLLSQISLPSAINSYLYSSFVAIIAFLVAIIVCFVLSLRWMYAIHFYTIDRLDFMSAVHKSARLKRSQRIQNLVSMLIIQGILAAANKVVSIVGIAVVAFILDNIGAKSPIGALLASVALIAFLFAAMLLGLLGMPIGALKISGKFYQLKEAAGETMHDVECREVVKTPRARMAQRIVGVVVVVFLVGSCAAYANQIALGNLPNQYLNGTRPQIISYQKGGLGVRQDTLASLDAIADCGADGATVEVQLSSDGVAFLAMSPDMSIVCGLEGQSSELTFSEIHDFSLKHRSSEDESIPNLEAALQRAGDNGITLILDISALSTRDNGLETVIGNISAANAFDRVEIASDSYQDLKRAQELAPEVRTVFLAGILGDDYESLAGVNAVALEGALITSDNVTALHNSGYKVYAWDVTSESKMNTAIRARIDALVAANVSDALNAADSLGLSEFEYTFYSHLQ